MRNKDCYETRLQEYMEQNLHPETAKHIGEIIFHSYVGSSEFAMNIILQMQLDHLRKDADVQQTTPAISQGLYQNRFIEVK